MTAGTAQVGDPFTKPRLGGAGGVAVAGGRSRTIPLIAAGGINSHDRRVELIALGASDCSSTPRCAAT